jgi:hypothetical protein
MQPDSVTHNRKRPVFVTWLAVAVFLLGVVNLGGVYAGISRWEVFAPLNLTLPLWALILIRGVWGLGWIVTAGGLWRLAGWARRAVLIAFPLYEAVMIGLPALLAQAGYERARLPFAAGLAVVLTAALAYGLTRMHIRQAFETHHTGEKDYEHRP